MGFDHSHFHTLTGILYYPAENLYIISFITIFNEFEDPEYMGYLFFILIVIVTAGRILYSPIP